MSVAQSQRLRRAADKAAKRKQVVAQKRREGEQAAKGGFAGLKAVVRAASDPVHACLAPGNMSDSGMGSVILARGSATGQITASFFLLDVFCLGVKDSYIKTMPMVEFERTVEMLKRSQPLAPIDPAVARALIEGAVGYASDLGFAPGGDFLKAKALFGGIDPSGDTFEFGKDGKPFYISGPNDSPARVRHILDTLGARTQLKLA
jgi:hypothetical protein